MSNPRFTGLLLLLTGVLILMGNTMDVLPAAAFWAGLATYPIGGYLFFMGSRQPLEKAEMRTARALNPRLKNVRGEAHARMQEGRVANPNAARDVAQELRAPAQAAVAEQARRDELVLYEIDADEQAAEGDGEPDEGFKVTTDVSFPLEIQEQESLADQLEKLSRLQQQGIISAEEYAIAKAKLLG